MVIPDVIRHLTASLESIRDRRFYETERGYQGALCAELTRRLPAMDVLGGAIIEQEYQKRVGLHGTKLRPDILIHVPTADGGDRKIGNVLACALKLRADECAAAEDFRKLDDLCSLLDYSFVAFINVDSNQTYVHSYTGPYAERFHFFATRLNDGAPRVVNEVISYGRRTR
jgi:hypothetical protein